MLSRRIMIFLYTYTCIFYFNRNSLFYFYINTKTIDIILYTEWINNNNTIQIKVSYHLDEMYTKVWTINQNHCIY